MRGNIWTEEQYAAHLRKDRPSWASTEKKFQGEVVKLATLFGWTWYHTWNSFHSAAGFPDLCLVRAYRLIFAELKTEKGETSAQQDKWLDLLKATEPSTHVEVYLWRPSMIEEIVRILK